MKKIILYILFLIITSFSYSCTDLAFHNSVQKLFDKGWVEIYNGKIYFNEFVWEMSNGKEKNTWVQALYLYVDYHYKSYEANPYELYGSKSGKKLAEYSTWSGVEILN